MKESPLREDLRDHRVHVDQRFDSLEKRIDRFVVHDHPEHPSTGQVYRIVLGVFTVVGAVWSGIAVLT